MLVFLSLLAQSQRAVAHHRPIDMQVEVMSITAAGLWLVSSNKEYFVPFDTYTAFRQASITQISRVEYHSPNQFHWPDLDIDIEAAALDEPERFPLQFHRT